MSESTLHTTDASFEADVLNASVPVLVDFWATWCGPCRVLSPILDDVAKEYAGRLKVAKVNVDESGHTASLFEVMSIPTLLLFKDGKVVAREVGAMPKAQLKQWIDQQLTA